MATASGGRASIVTSGSSSFGQFRLTQFVDNAPPNATTDNQQTPLAIATEDLGRIQMAQSSRPSSGQNIDRTPSNAPPRSLEQDENQPNSSATGFGTLELIEPATNPIIEGILGPNKDGRVRNPTPSKLKGKTDNKLGNFGVMHMGMSPGGKKAEAPGKEAAAERDAAARRTSENTASRAKAAQHEKYMNPKRKGLEGVNDGQPNRGSPFASSNSDQRQRARPLAPDETKFEQARLLTLLRSINPVTVVDQICKAVAYFGGIPGAPPPEDGIFPESANTRETGALFIGWLAEIFPDLSSPEVPKLQDPPGGRKSKMRPGRGGKSMPASEPPNPRNGFGYGQAVSAPAWGLPQSLSLVNTIGQNSSPEIGRAANPGSEANNTEKPRPSTPIKLQQEDNPPNTSSTSKRGRGRPKGSRNKGRNDPSRQTTTIGSASNDVGGHNQVSAEEQAHQSPEVPVQAQGRPEKLVPEPAAFVPQAPDQISTKSAQPLQYTEQSWQINPRKNHVEPSSAAPMDELSPEERAVLEAFRQPPVQPVSSGTPNMTTVKAPTSGGVKRKRAPAKPKSNTAAAGTVPTPEISHAVQPVGTIQQQATNETGSGMAKDGLQWAHVGTTTAAAPPAPKRQRQRKPKAQSMNDTSRTQAASSVTSTPPIPPSTIPDSQASTSQQSIPVSKPPAEGLEAHYERFASLPQQNGRSHTPSITPQQQLRQQQKTSSVPPTTQQPPAQQQGIHMQQQKSQQGIQRDDQKMSQGTSARSSSTGYYSQRTQPTPSYSQQYPSHQPSQLYGTHQASPQMSSSNSYRTSSSHTLAQASPQFSQTDNTYRTASPHTIAQPSPSFTQPDNNFRTTSSHSLAQPSPTYSQPESNYRTSSTHSITQPSPAYSRPHTQAQTTHQNHYNHFPDPSFVDLPTLESLGHSGTSNNTGVSLSGGPYGQSLGVGLGTSSSRAGSNSLYGTTSGLNNTFDTSTNDLLRGVSRSSVSNSAYGTSSGLSHTFDTGSEQDMRERLMKNMGGFNRR